VKGQGVIVLPAVRNLEYSEMIERGLSSKKRIKQWSL